LHPARADTFPNNVLEAFACGVPVVATAVGGIPEQIEDGRTGFLTPPGDTGALSDRLVDVLSSPELRKQLGEQAAQAARSRFDLRLQANAYLEWYGELVSR
jgi:glycosyltransferase involved in cell wall biosynthesis